MGVIRDDIAFLAAAARSGVDLTRTLTLGRQQLFAGTDEVAAGFDDGGMPVGRERAKYIAHDAGGFADAVFSELGAEVLDSLDVSDYEGATLIHDLNRPWDEGRPKPYDLVFDGGTLEHIFEIQTALRTVRRLVAPGGHFIGVNPANNYFGHGFYQFSADFYYRAYSAESGFQVLVMLVRNRHRGSRWYRPTDPTIAGDRVTMSGPWPANVYVLAKKVGEPGEGSASVMQSDYPVQWENRGAPRPRRREMSMVERRLRYLTSVALGTRSGPGHWRAVDLVALADRGWQV